LALLFSVATYPPNAEATPLTVPVVYWNAEITVPSTWTVFGSGASGCSLSTVNVLVGGTKLQCEKHTQPPGILTFGAITVTDLGTTYTVHMHGLAALVSTLHGSCGGELITVRSLRVQLRLCGVKLSGVVDSIRTAPRAAVVASGPQLTTPSSWRWTTLDGLRFATPSNWPIDKRLDVGCPWLDDYSDAPRLVLVRLSSVDASCPVPVRAQTRSDSLIVGGRTEQDVAPVQSLTINGVRFEVFRDQYIDTTGVLDLQATTPIGKTFVRITFGASDNGRIGREILDSMRST
jgi:hypothetical protein